VAGSLSAVLARRDGHGLPAGRAARILLDGGRLDADDARQRLSLTLSTASPPAYGAAFLEGFLAGDALLLLHDHALLGVIDNWVSAVAADTFDDVLPLLRRAFSAYQPAERRLLGDQLRRLAAGLASGPDMSDDSVDAARAARVQPLLRQLLGLPPLEPAHD